MMNKKEYLKSKKDCAKMLGMSLEEYENEISQVKIQKFTSKGDYGDKLLSKLGIANKDLKRKRVI